MLPVIIKEGNSWTPNFVGVREYSMTLHGQLLGFNDSVQGRGVLAGLMPIKMRLTTNMQIFGGK